jgi:hypothetical protein
VAPPNGCAEVSNTYDQTQVKGFQDAKGRIQKVDLVSAELTVLNGNTTGTSVATHASGQLSGSVGNATPVDFGSFNSVELTTGNTQPLTVNNGDASALLTQVAQNAPYEIIWTTSACADQFPAHFSVEIDLHTDISVKLF